MIQTRARVSRLLRDLHQHLSHHGKPSISTAHFSSFPNSRPSRGEDDRGRGRRRRDDVSEEDFLRTLNFGDDAGDQRPIRSPPNPQSRIPNRPLRGENRPEPPLRRRWPDGPSEDLPSRPMRGDPRREGFDSPRPNAPAHFANSPPRREGSVRGRPSISAYSENPNKGGEFSESILRNLKFGEASTGEEVRKPNSEDVARSNEPTVSESSVKDADEIFKKMKETGLIPNAVAMLDGLCKDGLIQEAMKLFGLMREKGSIPEVVVYTAVVEGFCKAGRFDDAKRVFRKMQTNGTSPNAFSYGVLIQGLCAGKKLEDSIEFCREMLDAGHSPNVVTFTGLIEGICREKGVEEAESAIRRLQERGFAVDEKAVREHLDKKGPFLPMVQEAIFGKKSSQAPL